MATFHFGLVGKALTHSVSADYFQQRMLRLGLSHTYSLFPIASETLLPNFLSEHRYLTGLNVTIPYKTSIIPHLFTLDEAATKIGAVNTLVRTTQGWSGFNTDWIAFLESLKKFLPHTDMQALVFGNGGAAKAVTYALSQMDMDYKVVSRTPGPKDLAYAEIDNSLLADFELLINTTPLGMYPDVHSAPNIPAQGISDHHFLYDLVYNPELTPFLQWGVEAGARVKNGMEMLHRQADEAWNIWLEEYPDLMFK